MDSLRIAQKCFQADSVIPARCSCCSAVTILLLDDRDRVRAVCNFSVEDLRLLLADAEADKLPTYSVGGSHSPLN